jgi:hypothetical protein
MSGFQGFQACPRCKTNSLPRIAPESLATATRCQNCGAVIELVEHKAIAERARLKAIEDAKTKAVEESK